jgi:hypothetical protein
VAFLALFRTYPFRTSTGSGPIVAEVPGGFSQSHTRRVPGIMSTDVPLLSDFQTQRT